MNAQQEIGILYKPPMIVSILSGCKTQTRRIVRNPLNPYGKEGDLHYIKQGFWQHGHYAAETSECGTQARVRPKTAFKPSSIGDLGEGVIFSYDGEKPKGRSHIGWHKRSPLFMLKCRAQIWMRVADVRVERLQEITAADAISEGINKKEVDGETWYENYSSHDKWFLSPIYSFESLWDSINFDRAAWATNPLVRVVSFELVSTTGRPKELPNVYKIKYGAVETITAPASSAPLP